MRLEPFKGKPAAKALSAMPNLFGGIEVLDEVESLTGNVRVLGATAYLRRLYQALDEAGYGDRIMIDLGLVHEMDYYTGIMFRGYIGGAGAAKAASIKNVEVIAYDELGCESVKRLTVENFSAIVSQDSVGGNLYTEGVQSIRRIEPKGGRLFRLFLFVFDVVLPSP